MALSNAERQQRYRQRLKARASPDGVAALARAAVDRAVAVLWRQAQADSACSLVGPDGNVPPASIAATRLPLSARTLGAFRANLAATPDGLLQACRRWHRDSAGRATSDALAITTVIELDEALQLAAPADPAAWRHHRLP